MEIVLSAKHYQNISEIKSSEKYITLDRSNLSCTLDKQIFLLKEKILSV